MACTRYLPRKRNPRCVSCRRAVDRFPTTLGISQTAGMEYCRHPKPKKMRKADHHAPVAQSNTSTKGDNRVGARTGDEWQVGHLVSALAAPNDSVSSGELDASSRTLSSDCGRTRVESLAVCGRFQLQSQCKVLLPEDQGAFAHDTCIRSVCYNAIRHPAGGLCRPKPSYLVKSWPTTRTTMHA